LICVLAEINLSKHTEKNAADFEKEVAACPQITECYSTTGNADYMIKVVTTDIKAYETFMHNALFKLPGVEHVRSSIVLREVKCDPRLPLIK
ncbi:MAG: Lrp/AsnC ligand binding domain-containing protein, partial [Oxalobacteraceae bacterium]